MNGYLFTEAHTITSSSELTDYQLRFIVSYNTGTSSGNTLYTGGLCFSDFSDVRFSVNQTDALSYWVEFYASGDYAIFWVKVPTLINGDNTIYAHYGNENAVDESSMTNTFPFCDDFLETTLDESKWTWGGNGSKTINDGIISMTLAASRSGNSIVALTDQTGSGYISHVSMRLTSGDCVASRAQISLLGSSSNGTGVALQYVNGTTVRAVPLDQSDVAGTVISNSLAFNTFYTIELHHDGTNLHYRMSPVDAWITRSSTTGSGTHLKLFNVASSIDYSIMGSSTSAFDYVFQRKYAASEPIHGAWASGAKPKLSRTFIIG